MKKGKLTVNSTLDFTKILTVVGNDTAMFSIILVINSNQKQRPAPVPGRVDAVLRGEHRLHLDSNVLSSDLPSHLVNIGVDERQQQQQQQQQHQLQQLLQRSLHP